MSDRLKQAKLLIDQEKYQKALAVLKKTKPHSKEEKFNLTELESVCLINLGTLPLAKIKMEKALSYASTEHQRLNTLNNLILLNQKLEQPQQVLKYLIQSIEIDGSVLNANKRMHLVKTAYSLGEHEIVNQYALPLVSLNEYAMNSLLYLINSNLKTENNDRALQFLAKANGEIRAKNNVAVTSKQIMTVLGGYKQLNENKKALSLLQYLEKDFAQETWFAETKRSFSQQKPTTAPASQIDKAIESPHATLKKVKGNSAATVKILEKLLAKLEAKGAVFHRGLQIVEHNGDLSVTNTLSSEGNEVFMQVPFECMPIISDFKWHHDNGKLVATLKKNAVNPKANEIMALVCDLFNATDKLNKWKQSFPLFQLAGHSKLVNALLMAKGHPKLYQQYYADTTEAIPDNVLIDSFLGSRRFRFRSNAMRKAKIKLKKDSEPAIIPVIELMNHKMGVHRYVIDSEKANLKTFTSKNSANQEVFVQYNLDDPLFTFLTYGFIDVEAPWVYSIPLSINAKSGLVIDVFSQIGSENYKNLPESLRNISLYCPSNSERQQNHIAVNMLIIPHVNNASSLGRVLGYIIKKYDAEGLYVDEKRLADEVSNLEKQLVDQNINYWQTLEQLVTESITSNCPPSKQVAEQLQELCKFYLQHIVSYAAATGHMLKE